MTEAELFTLIDRRARDLFHACAGAAADGDELATRDARAAQVVFNLASLLLRVRSSAGDRRILHGKLTDLTRLLERGPRAGHRLGLEELERELEALQRQDDLEAELAGIADAFERKAG